TGPRSERSSAPAVHDAGWSTRRGGPSPESPVGAPGLAQCAELPWQLRDDAGDEHSIGLSGAAVVTVYRTLSFG
ncbi:MAG: hypothetical protein ACRDQD_32200, partial [Nocardioidaceae bacterium]